MSDFVLAQKTRHKLESAVSAFVKGYMAEQAKLAHDEQSPLMSLAETAAMLRVHLLTVRALIKKGKLKTTHIGRRHLVFRSSVHDLIESKNEMYTPPRYSAARGGGEATSKNRGRETRAWSLPMQGKAPGSNEGPGGPPV